MAGLVMLIPSRNRPESVDRMVEAWRQSDPLNEARMRWIVDQDDPTADGYREAFARHPSVEVDWMHQWMPMVSKLNWVAPAVSADLVGFMGDDHLPRTPGWAVRLAAANVAHGPGIFYGRDGLKDIKLPTWWVMSKRIVTEIDGLVPCDVEHMYCDNAVLELGKSARCLRFISSILIEHMHPVAGKAGWDEQYKRVNAPDQYEHDRAIFVRWLRSERLEQAGRIRSLRG